MTPGIADITTGPIAGKVVLVTGGIGQATAIDLAAMGARAGITGRDIARTRAAAADVAAASGNPAVDPFGAGMSSQAEVRRLAREVLAAYPRLDVLVSNAGGFWATRRVTRRRPGAHLRGQPPRPVSAHRSAPGPGSRPARRPRS
jgi:NAD(P)-dependent dehydrogenase (short-subunit alcohol dehydrogenase family)